MNRFRKNQSGFTMIELMVVVVIVGVLAAIAIPIYGKYVNNARVTEAMARCGEIMTSAKSFAQENGTWPTSNDDGYGIFDLTPTENFSYEISAGGGANTDQPFAVKGVGTTRKVVGVSVTYTLAQGIQSMATVDVQLDGEVTSTSSGGN